MAEFCRGEPLDGRTLAWRLFKRSHTHFNDIYWAHRVAKTHAYAATRGASRDSPVDSKFETGDIGRRAATTLSGWGQHYDHFHRWTHMAAVLAMAGYLETYIAQIATSALESSPAHVFGGGGGVDGAIYLKFSPKYDLYDYVEPLVRGDWQARASAFSKLFGEFPYKNDIGVLEKIRKLRNDASHSFGRDIGEMKFAASWVVQPIPKIREDLLQAYLGCIERVAIGIEGQLGRLVGSFEIVKVFHRWHTNERGSETSIRLNARRFNKHLIKLAEVYIGPRRAVSLIEYYERLSK